MVLRNMAVLSFPIAERKNIIVTEEDVELYKNEETSIISPALKEGKVLYAA